MLRRSLVILGLLATLPPAARGEAPATPLLLLQHPSLSRDAIAFDYGGEIWTVPRAGGRAQRLVSGEDRLSAPIFSPDGSRIAFTGRYDGNTDVYVVDAQGGEPRRLTWHPGPDEAVGWTPDSRAILFRSPRATPRDLDQLYTVPATGGTPTQLPLPSGEVGSFSPDGKRLAYTPILQWQPAWKKYRGGQTARIWIADLATSHVIAVPRPNSNDGNPIWVGGKLYFLSDRDGPVSLYVMDVASGTISRCIDNSGGYDIKSAAAGPDGSIVLDHFSRLEIFHPETGKIERVPVTIAADLPQRRAHFVPVKPGAIEAAAITATGKRVLIETRGEILSVPADKGDVRNLTQSPGVADRAPAASPDGKSVAYFSDESGEYALHIRPADGLGTVRKIALPEPSFFYELRWSPDSHKILYHDKHLHLWMVDLAGAARPVLIDTTEYGSWISDIGAAWSPDSRWIVYTKPLRSFRHAAFVYALDTGHVTQITDGLSDVGSPRFDRNGKYLYFTASTDLGPVADGFMMSSLGRAQDAAAYVMVLKKGVTSPIAPQSDEENAADAPRPGPQGSSHHAHRDGTPDAAAEATPAKPADKDGKNAKPDKPARVSIDFDGLDQRIVALPIPRANFVGLEVGAEGIVYTLTQPVAQVVSGDDDDDDDGAATLFRFDLAKRANEQIAADIASDSFAVSADGTKILLQRKGSWIVAPGDGPLKDGNKDQHTLKFDGTSVWVDPAAEWRQMFAETWRVERDFFYDPHLHGLDLPAAIRTYAPYLAGIAARQDLNALFEEMTGQLSVGHTFIRGGDLPSQPQAKVGLLGADYAVANGHWQITRILHGENFNPSLVAPLSQPGIDVKPGQYLIAVNGRPVGTDREVYAAFDGLGGKRTVLSVSTDASGAGAHDVTVVPVASETALRLRDWMETNRRAVDRLSGGKLAYVYVPDTADGGYANFNRYYFAQSGREGAIIDERFNHGGLIADYIVDQLLRTPQLMYEGRDGARMVEPSQAIFGPKVMLINEMSGSGGDALPWLFRRNHGGTLVGERTWGGLVGIGGYPKLIDGGRITAPRTALYGLHGQFEVENIGIPPDIEVPADPEQWRHGHDAQLERAVAVALDALKHSPPQIAPVPAYPDKHPVLPTQP